MNGAHIPRGVDRYTLHDPQPLPRRRDVHFVYRGSMAEFLHPDRRTAYQRLKWRRTKQRLLITANVLFFGAIAALWIFQEISK